MPELPDVEGFRRRAEAVVGGTVETARVFDARLLADGLTANALDAALAGHRLTETRRHGKHLFLPLSDNGVLVLHFGMSGALATVAGNTPLPPHTRVAVDCADRPALAVISRRLLGGVAVAASAEAWIDAHGLGPDPLDAAFDRATFKARLGGRRGQVKAALMDQGLAAGIGNIFADEILFRAGVHPRCRADRLDDAALDRLYDAVRAALEAAIEAGAGQDDAFPATMPAGSLLPHRVEGGTCPVCGTPLTTLKAAGRTAWLCPRCQPAP